MTYVSGPDPHEGNKALNSAGAAVQHQLPQPDSMSSFYFNSFYLTTL